MINQVTISPSRNFFFWLIFLFNLILILFLLLSYAAAYVSPDGNFWWLQIIGLAYGFILIANIAFVIFWLLMRKKKFLYSLIAILLGYGRIFGIVQPFRFTNYELRGTT